MIDNKLIGALVTIYMINGNVYEGALRDLSDNNVVLVNPSGRVYKISKIDNIEAISYIIDNDKIVYEKKQKKEIPDEEIPQHAPYDTKSLIELRRMQANDDLKQIRKKFTSNKPTAEGIQYASPISSLYAAKKYTGE
ncbi:MAG: hypothetical protein ACOYMA_00760 [Bacteroidia bacterium]